MFGYACDETPELMPLPIALAHRLMREALQAAQAEASSISSAPTARARSPCDTWTASRSRIDAVVISTQHHDDVRTEQLREAIIEEIDQADVPAEVWSMKTTVSTSIRPAASSSADRMATAGLTGRKIIVDTYGGMGRHGGGAFSGKDPTKVDRSACYMARYIAKNIVAAGLATRAKCSWRTRSAWPSRSRS